jgi:ElaB/YqjD/DUF883 family membrane-anchored ribosome-binding protein
MTAEPVARLAAEASAASQKLGQTISEVRARTNPDALFEEAYDMASEQAQKLVTKTRETVNAHPVAIGAAVAAIGLALLARNTLAKATVDLGDGSADYTDYDDSYEAAPIEAAAPDGQNPLISAVVGLAMGALISLFTAKN